jgi:tetratricopeptide (TPR) repeat protein
MLSMSWGMAQTASDPVEIMALANQQYEAGEFEQAIDNYESIRRAGIKHSHLYYNLGNAYFKQGDFGQAILNYRRAKQLSPRDPQINTNLRIARAQTIDKIADNPHNFVTILAYSTESWFTQDEVTFLAFCLWVLLCFLMTLTILFTCLSRVTKIAIVGVAMILALMLGSVISRFYLAQQYPPVVIVAEAVDVTGGPGSSERYPVEFRLHSGTEARLVDQQNGWYHISLSNNLQGWLPVETIEFVEDNY